jgi:predicted nucleic acid-binding protein
VSFLADTFYWIALTNPKDSAHGEVIRFTASLAPRSVLTTDEVLTEFLAFCSSDQRLRRQAGLAVERLINDPDIRIVPQSRSTFLAGLTLYNARPDKEYSLTDCISMETMRREGLTEVLTNDKHFEQEGFRALFRHS